MNGPVVLQAALAALAAVLLVLGLAISGRRIGRQAGQRGRGALAQPVYARLLAVVAGEAEPEDLAVLADLGRVRWAAIEGHLLRLLRKVHGEGRQLLVDLLDVQGRLTLARRRTRAFGSVRRARAAELLGLAGRVDAVPDLVLLLTDRSPEVRQVAARALGRIGDPAATPHLVAALADRSVPARSVAPALVRLAPEADDLLTAAAIHPDRLVRSFVVEVLGLRGSPAVVPVVTVALERDPDAEVRLRAAKALGRIGLPSSFRPLLRAVHGDPSDGVRAFAARALGDVGDPAAVQTLRRLLADPAYWVAHNSARALARLGPEGLTALRLATGSRRAGAVAHAREALAVAHLERVGRVDRVGARLPTRRPSPPRARPELLRRGA